MVDKKWFIKIGCSWSLQAGEQEMLCPMNFVGYSFIVKGKVGRGKKPLSSWSLSRCHASNISSSPRSGRGAFCPYVVKPGLSRLYGKIISGLSTMSIFYFEISAFYKLLFYACREHVQGLLSSWAHWAGCGSQGTIILLFYNMSQASWFCCWTNLLRFVVK